MLLGYLVLVIIVGNVNASMPICDKTPHDQSTDKTPGDHGFSVQISGFPRKYRPNQTYTIKLQGIREEHVAKFQGFLLVAEYAARSTALQTPISLGTFQLMPGDAMTKFSHKCSHAVEATSSISKEEIQVYWTSPPRGSGCIDFKAMVVERQDVWFMDDGGLTYSMCEDDSPLAEPTVVEPCCACNEAKYEVIFQGIWSRHTHPKDFPRDEWRTQFSTLIGASHSENYTLWEYGRESTPALQFLGENGITRKIEMDMKRYTQHIRSVVKAHGLQQRSNVAGETFAVFRVDPMHHLLSLVSKMIPSPDWIVGLSKENLCLPNCSWVANRVIDLYPWDIGTDSGLRYSNPRMPQHPRGKIQRITSSNPHSPESPFFDPTGAPMKPAARLHLIRQREYIKTCPDGRSGRPGSMLSGPLNPSWNSPGALDGGYGSTAYNDGYGSTGSGYGETSYTYGTGIGQQLGTNTYEDTYNSGSSQPEYDYGGGSTGYGGGSTGYGGESTDYGGNNAEIETTGYNSDPCQTSEWGYWSECSATCDSGSRSRQREYTNRESSQMHSCSDQLFEKEPCQNLPKCETRSYSSDFMPFPVDKEFSDVSTPWLERGLESGSQAQSYNPQPYGNSYTYGGLSEQPSHDNPVSARLNGLPLSDASPNCDVSLWGDWSDCSSKCDRGSRTRSRIYTIPDASSTCSLDLYEHQPCRGNGPDCPQTRNQDYSPPPVAGMGFGGGLTGSGDNNRPVYQPGDAACQTSDWSEWSPCSKKCGAGHKRRTRLYLIPFVPNRSCDVRLYDRTNCYGNDQNCGTYGYYGDSTSSFGFDNDYSADTDAYEASTNVVIQSLGDNNNNNYNNNNNNYNNNFNSNNLEGADPILDTAAEGEDNCSIEPDEGRCHGHVERWYYDTESGTCKTFSYSGCYGNRNNFGTEQKCRDTCVTLNNNRETSDDRRSSVQYSGNDVTAAAENARNEKEENWRQIKSLSFIKLPETEETQPETHRPAFLGPGHLLDCQVTAWSQWSQCSKSCGIGWQTRQREVMVPPSMGGKMCPKKLVRRRKCRPMPCPANTKYWYQGSWRHMTGPEA